MQSYQLENKHILPNIGRSIGNQTMKFCQVIENNVRNIIIERPYPKCVGETSPTSLSKKSKLSISLHQQYEILYSLLLLYVQVEDYPNILILRHWLLAFTLYKAFFKKIRRSLELVSLPHFFFHFKRKNFFTLYSINWPNFII